MIQGSPVNMTRLGICRSVILSDGGEGSRITSNFADREGGGVQTNQKILQTPYEDGPFLFVRSVGVKEGLSCVLFRALTPTLGKAG